ncbi:uncharacterized protein LOC144079188 isoform X2 [Stigmatopora argus]
MRGYRGVKYFLFIFCYVFWVLSAILIAVGIYAKVAKEKDVVDTLTVDPALLLMAVGSLTFSIAFLGCFGALRNAICLLKTVGRRGPPLASTPLDGALPFLRTSPVRLHPGGLAPAAADGGNSGIRLHGSGDGANAAADDENGASLPGGPRLGERHRLCAEEAAVLRCGRLQGLVPERLLPVLRLQSQSGSLRRPLLLLRAPRQPDGAEHHVRFRDAAPLTGARRAPRLPRWMRGQDRPLARPKRQDGGRARRRTAAPGGMRDVAGLGAGLLDPQSPAATPSGARQQERVAQEGGRVVARFRRL